ncbi:MAG TPA: phenylalanine--tRNA ligase subunit beta [Candidatus Binatia bacterium]|nr:phenylalanine--tRNA ligase subunit beta [Candidatus Binatia bacterium]
MNVSLRWLREWVQVKASDEALAERLTLAGIEATVEPLPRAPDRVVVGRIQSIRPHPQADRLRVCEVDTGSGTHTIVCGAANAREGMIAPVALAGARLPNGTEIRQAALRGVESAGMLCSAQELGLAEKSEGLLELDADARVGAAIGAHLALDDALLVPELTPNRGDCLSVRGLAREIAAIHGVPFSEPAITPVKPASKTKRAVRIADRKGCVRYAGRAIDGVVAGARTPDWMRERLRRAGLRSISPLVDVTNYVLLELGQPLHAFDAGKLQGPIQVRRARAGERLTLLNDQPVELDAADLVIADDSGPVALAGVMGGAATAVGATTTAVFLESACFDPASVAATARRHRINSDAAYRFERGVDPSIQRTALERATALVVQLCGGAAGAVSEAGVAQPKPLRVTLRRERLLRLLGMQIADRDVERLLPRLGIALKRLGRIGWIATIPPHRHDLRIEPDLIEEVARLHGYDRIPAQPYAARLVAAPVTEQRRPLSAVHQRLAARGWQEVITYSFVSPALQARIEPAATPVALDNPMADTQSVMRTSLWPGLVETWRYNRQRQQPRVRIYEAGVCFSQRGRDVVEQMRIAGLAAGSALPEQWGTPSQAVDLYAVKSDLLALLGADAHDWSFEPGEHPALHPGQSARVLRAGRPAGWLGALHPRLRRELDLGEGAFVFELDAEAVLAAGLPKVARPPDFPSVRRDLAVVVKDEVAAQTLLDETRTAGGPLLRQARIFDVYRGAGLPNGCKSMALGLIFQDNSRTLTDAEVESAVQAVMARLGEAVGASIRT